jgi:caffeoyl-CoA O-methyltransferase
LLAQPVGRLLTMLASVLRPRLAVDVGTFTGYSALSIAEGLEPGAKVISCERDAARAAIAARYFARSTYGDRIELRIGPALDTLHALDEPIGLAFIDGDKSEYWDYYEVILARLEPRGIIVVDNTLMLGGAVLGEGAVSTLQPMFRSAVKAIVEFNRRVQDDSRTENCLLTAGDGVTLITRRVPTLRAGAAGSPHDV